MNLSTTCPPGERVLLVFFTSFSISLYFKVQALIKNRVLLLPPPFQGVFPCSLTMTFCENNCHREIWSEGREEVTAGRGIGIISENVHGYKLSISMDLHRNKWYNFRVTFCMPPKNGQFTLGF